MRITQQDVDGVAKSVEGVRDDLAEVIKEAAALLPAKDAQYKEAFTAAMDCASALMAALNGTAALIVGLRWQRSINEAFSKEGATTSAVLADLKNFTLASAMQLDKGTSVVRNAFNTAIVEQGAETAVLVEFTAQTDLIGQKICDENGLDYAAVKAGDAEVIKKFIEVAAKTKDVVINPSAYAKYNVEPPAGQPDAPTSMREALGLDKTFTPKAAEGEGEETIRA